MRARTRRRAAQPTAAIGIAAVVALAGCRMGVEEASSSADPTGAAPSATTFVRWLEPPSKGVVLERLKESDVSMRFAVTGSVVYQDGPVVVDGAYEITATGTGWTLTIEARGATDAIEARQMDGTLFVRHGDQVPWFDEGEAHTGDDLSGSWKRLLGLETRDREPGDAADRWRFASHAAVVAVDVPGLTTGGLGLEGELGFVVDAFGDLTALEVTERWKDPTKRAGSPRVSLDLRLTLEPGTPDALEVPEILFVRHQSWHLGYTIGVPDGVFIQEGVGAGPDVYVLDADERVVVARGELPDGMTVEDYVRAFARAQIGGGKTADGSGTVGSGACEHPMVGFREMRDGRERLWRFALVVEAGTVYQVGVDTRADDPDGVDEFLGIVTCTLQPMPALS